jgi:hypothetical protein
MTIMSKVDHLELVTEFPSIPSISIYIVDDTGIEPVTPSMSRKYATAALIVRWLKSTSDRNHPQHVQCHPRQSNYQFVPL